MVALGPAICCHWYIRPVPSAALLSLPCNSTVLRSSALALLIAAMAVGCSEASAGSKASS